MRILTITTLFPNQEQPTHAVFVKNRITALAKLCEVKVVAPVPWVSFFKIFGENYQIFSKIPSEEIQGNIEVFHPRYLVTPGIGRALYGIMYFLSILGFIRKIKKNYDFNLLDVHWAYPDGFAGVLLAKFFKVPVTITIRGTDINLYSNYFLRGNMIAWALKNANWVIAVCKDMEDKVLKLGVEKTKFKVIPNGVDTNKFYPLEKDNARENLGLAKEKIIILYVGRLGYPKRIDHIIEAVNILIKEKLQKEILLIVVGKGEYQKQLENQIEELNLNAYVRLVGSKPNEELVYWYNAADIFCLASSSEGWPNVIFESLACGTPVVAYAVGGVPEVLCSEEYGILVKEQNFTKLSEELWKALEKRWHTDKIIEYAQQNTWDKVAEKVYKTFQSLEAFSE